MQYISRRSLNTQENKASADRLQQIPIVSEENYIIELVIYK